MGRGRHVVSCHGPEFWQSTMENWPSEFLQLLTFVVLTTYLVYRGSHESKDQDDVVLAMLQRIESRLDDIATCR